MKLRRTLLVVHRWLGLLLALPLALAALSGTLLAAGKPLDEWLNRHLFQAPSGAAHAPPAVDAVLASLRQRYGDRAGLTLRMPQTSSDNLRVFVRSAEFSGMAFYAPRDATWLGQRGQTEGWWPWLLELHSDLLLGDAGKALLAASTAGTLLLLVAGGVLGWPRRGGAAFWPVWRASSVRRWRGIHRAIGLLLLPLLLALIASGGYMVWKPVRGWVSSAMGETPFKPPQLPKPAPSTPHLGATPPSLSSLLAQAQADWPEGRIVYVTVRPDEPIRVRVKLPHDPHPNGLSSVWLDPRDGRELARVRVDQLDAGQRWVSWIYPLHSAQLMGSGQRAAWALLGAVLWVLLASGLWLWWRRRLIGKAITPSRLG